MDGEGNEPTIPEVRLRDLGEANPYLHFVVSEAYASAAAAIVYCFARAIAFLLQLVDKRLPLDDGGPMNFLEQVMAWGGVIATATVFLVITSYQLIVLIKRLYKGVSQ
ncbi:hypothetical protein RHSP_63537 [Rhizobium freirei PRF 81]|uniref:Transmembrane protein n=1 Tax=Rhizobium freirei PRF 81 TaxID=363754 RepID=N6V3E9_9HYPH|nr:hypothetical protein [Rhizobium freirei]ENN87611.1 hypothetical protein RHSP_63537 [Rhizobium freirei PRF 81]